MDKLNFFGKLDAEQRQNAEKVAQFASDAGVDPFLAVAIAYKEGSLRTNAPRGSSGEIGMMQVMPKTGLGLGYDEKKLSNPNQNIKAGIAYLKQGLQAADNSPELAAIYYNGGPGALEALRAGKEPDPRVFDYVRGLNGYGTFGAAEATPAAPAEAAPGEAEAGGPPPGQDGLTLVASPPPKPPPPPNTDTSGADPGDRLLFGLGGAGAGTVFTGANAWMQNRDAAAVRRAGLEEQARIRTRRDEANARTALLREQQAAERLAVMRASNPANAASTAAGALPTAAGVASPAGAAPGGLTGGSGPTAQSVRIQQGTTGDLGTTGRQRSTFNDDTSKLSASQKLAYNNVDILKNMGLVDKGAAEVFANNPGFTATESGVLHPRSEPAKYAGPRPGNVWQTREGPKASLYPPAAVPPAPQLPPGAMTREQLDEIDRILAAQAAKPKPTALQSARSGLSAVGDMFTSMMKPLAPAANAAGRAIQPLLGPFAGVSTGLDVAEIAHEMNKPPDQRSAGKIFLKGLSAGTGALSMVPGPQQRITVPASLGASAAYELMYNEDLKNYMRQKLGMDPKVTEPQVTP